MGNSTKSIRVTVQSQSFWCYLIRRQPHELLGLLIPDGWYSDDPANVVVVDGRSTLVAEFAQGVIFKELERHGDGLRRRKALSVRCLYLQIFRTVLQR